MRRITVEPGSLSATQVELSPATRHYVARVLRLAANTEVELCDGAGVRVHGRLTDGGVEVIERHPVAPAPRPAFRLLQAVGKGDKMDVVVRQAAELGAIHLMPVVTERTVRTGDRQARWQAIAEDALRVTGRAYRMVVEATATFEEVSSRHRPGLDLVLDGSGATRVADLDRRPPEDCWMWVGPEGGWSEDERDVLAQAGATFLTLGPANLRTETAGSAGLAVLGMAVWAQ